MQWKVDHTVNLRGTFLAARKLQKIVSWKQLFRRRLVTRTQTAINMKYKKSFRDTTDASTVAGTMWKSSRPGIKIKFTAGNKDYKMWM